MIPSPQNCVVLCHNCHNIAPRDPFLLENLFLRFASIKEMVQFYNASNEQEAIKSFSEETGIKYEEIKRMIKEDPISHVDTIKNGMRKRAESAGHSRFNIPYGYDYEDQNLKINSDEADVVKQIYRWYLAGKSLGEIVEMLSYQNIPTKKRGKWAKKTISAVLKNPIYCGYHRFEGGVTKGDHSKIIDLKSYQKVQNLISENGGKPNFYIFP